MQVVSLRPVPIAIALTTLALLLGAGSGVDPATAAEAFFPPLPPPTQVSRQLTLQQAAQAGLVKMQAKGGSEGDAVSLELEAKQVHAPIVVTIHAEVTVEPGKTPEEEGAVRQLTTLIQQQAQADLDRNAYKTSGGDPLSFVLDYRYRTPEEPPRPNFHQIKIINPNVDLEEPDPRYRNAVNRGAVPNGETPVDATFSSYQLQPSVMAHEAMHLAGIGDRYGDFYVVGGREYPLPKLGMNPRELKEFAISHKLPPPPQGHGKSGNEPGTDKCDMMGVGEDLSCHKLAQRDVDWLASQAGVQVVTTAGESLLDKESERQNFGVAFKTTVFAAPGSTTVAPGVAVYCLDHDRFFPLTSGFDVGPQLSELPGYAGAAKLLALNGANQPGLNDSVTGMQAAIWNITDGTPLATSGSAEESRALMAQAGVAEDSVPGGSPPIADPNAAAPTTGAIGADGAVLPAIPAQPIASPPPFRFYGAQLYPKKFPPGAAKAQLLVGTTGAVEGLSVQVQHKVKKKWQKVKTISRKLTPGRVPVGLGFGKLKPGKYRLLVAVSGGPETATAQTVPFSVKSR
jgi:hypothetical protein